MRGDGDAKTRAVGVRHGELLDLFRLLRHASDDPPVRQIARLAGMSASHVSAVLHGTKIPSSHVAERLVAALKGDGIQQKNAGRYAGDAAEERRSLGLGLQHHLDSSKQGRLAESPSSHWIRQGYLEQVREIAPIPGGLAGRATELAELAAFCAGNEAYTWWQGSAWAGKTALMSTFVVNPPPSVDVVSYFITSRLPGQADSDSFTGALIDQLAALLGEAVPPTMTSLVRDGYRRAMLRSAAERCLTKSRHLVLVVDGLDEDRGTVVGSGQPSIASLLPKNVPPGLRVIVSSRPDPPIPADAPDDHPLRYCSLRRLVAFRDATKTRDRAKRELDVLLAGDRVHRDLLGLLTACGGGIQLSELEELTDVPYDDLDRTLGGVLGRTIVGRPASDRDSAPTLLLFAHEALREQAVDSFGPRALDAYRQRLFRWADSYQDRGWPPDTPQYLLTGYPNLLLTSSELQRLITLATEPSWLEQLRHATGGDSAGLAVIAAVHRRLLREPVIDFTAIARLALHRDKILDNNRETPVRLPAVWAALGETFRARSMALAMPGRHDRTLALEAIAEALAETGHTDAAETMARDIERRDPDPAWPGLAASLARGGAPERAADVALSISNPYRRATALASVAEAASAAGNHGQAVDLADEILTIADETEDDGRREWLLRPVVRVLTAAGAPERAEAVARRVNGPGLLIDVLAAAASRGDIDRADAISAGLEDRSAAALAALSVAAAAAGDTDRAARLADQCDTAVAAITDADALARTLSGLVTTLANAGDKAQARTMLPALLTAELRRPADDEARWDRQAHVVKTAVDVQAFDFAEELGRGIGDPSVSAGALSHLVTALADTGDLDRAEAIARLPRHYADNRAELLTELARWCVASSPGRAARLAVEATKLTRRIGGSEKRFKQENALTLATASTGDFDLAERLVRASVYSESRRILAGAAELAGDYERVAKVVDEPRQYTNLNDRAELFATLARSAAQTGNPQRSSLWAARAEALQPDPPEGPRLQRAESALRLHRSPDNRHASSTAWVLERATVTGHSDTLLLRRALAQAANGDPAGAGRIITEIMTRVRRGTSAELDARRASAEVLAYAGDMKGAVAVVDELPKHSRDEALPGLAHALQHVNRPDQAATVARRINAAELKARTLSQLAISNRLAFHTQRADVLDREAESIASSITDGPEQARALVEISLHAPTEMAKRCVARALAAAHWEISLSALTQISPAAVRRLAEDWLAL